MKDKVLQIQHKFKVAKDRFEYGVMNIIKRNREVFCDFQYRRYQTRHFENFLIFIPKMV